LHWTKICKKFAFLCGKYDKNCPQKEAWDFDDTRRFLKSLKGKVLISQGLCSLGGQEELLISTMVILSVDDSNPSSSSGAKLGIYVWFSFTEEDLQQQPC
jgi:hypothetical protein